MDEDERWLRTQGALAAEMLNPRPGMYWLSFADGDDGHFLGGCMVEADGPISAIRRTHELGINPGGEVAVIGPAPAERMPPGMADRLLSQEDLGEDAVNWEIS